MHSIGDLLIYPGHGICQVEDIREMELAGVTRAYYILHPIENDQQLTLHLPTDSEKVVMQKLLNKEEAERILETLALDGVAWIEKHNQRSQQYKAIIKQGDRLEIAKVVATLLRKKQELEKDGRKFYEADTVLLTDIQDILYKELSLVFETTTEHVAEIVDQVVH